MVVFICNGCGDSLKKQQVEKHLLQICRRSLTVSCVDCSKDFTLQTHKDHIKCFTEDEKYSGKNYQPKVNKGQVKQEQWTQRVQEALSNLGGADRQLGNILERMLSYDNIPRKKAKFENFMRNSFRSMVNPPMIERIWNIVESQAKPPPPPTTVTESSGENKEDNQKKSEGNDDSSPAKRQKIEKDEEEEEETLTSAELPKFKLSDFIIDLLTKKQPGLSFDKLFKRIIKESSDATKFRPSKKMVSFDEVKLEKALAKLSDAGALSFTAEEKDRRVVLLTSQS